MMRPLILVVGATGQLGGIVVRKLSAKGLRVRAMVRRDSSAAHLKALSVERVEGDLLDSDSLRAACDGVDYVIATANAAVPRKPSDRFQTVDGKGYRDLIDHCAKCGVRQFVYTSVTSTPADSSVPLFRTKRAVERYLETSGLTYTIIRAAAFMDVSFAMMGSDLPLRGSEAPTAERPFWFIQRFFGKTRNSISGGRAMVPGDGRTRHSFIAINDVADYLVRSLELQAVRNKTFEVGGPEPLSSRDVVGIYEKVLNQKLRISTTPAFAFKTMAVLLTPFSPAAANIMALNHLTATVDGIVPDASRTADQFGIQLTTAEQFLRQKLSVRN